MDKIKKFIQKHKKIYLPYIIKRFDIKPEELGEYIAHMWDEFPNPRMVENLLIKNNTIKCNYYEICDTKYNRGNYIKDIKLEDHSYYTNDSDQHVSVYKHDRKWCSNVESKGSVTCSDTWVSADWIYIELDRSEGYQKALEDAIKIYNRFPYKDHMLLWYSGNNSVHIAVHASLFGYPLGKQQNVCGLGKLFYNIAHKISGDIRHSNGLVHSWLANENDIFKKYYETFDIPKTKGDISEMRQELENVDPNLYRVNSLIRQPWSKHEKTGNMKCLIEPDKSKWGDNEFISKKKLDIEPEKPYLVHWVPELYKPIYKKTPIIEIPDIKDDTIVGIYSILEGFDPRMVDDQGWINGLYSPFYEDTNPSVAVNVKTGLYKDHGNPTHTFGVVEFYSKLKDISHEEAEEKIKG